MTTNCWKFQPKWDAIDGHIGTQKICNLKYFFFISISPEGEGNNLNTRDLDTQNTVTAEVRKFGKSNSLFLLFHLESISSTVNILVSAIENLS